MVPLIVPVIVAFVLTINALKVEVPVELIVFTVVAPETVKLSSTIKFPLTVPPVLEI